MTNYSKLEIPIEKSLNDRLQTFWQDIFGESPDIEPGILLGEEKNYNQSTLYLIETDDLPTTTTMVTTCNQVPELGGFSVVATRPESRGKGLGTKLCQQSITDFKALGGKALFLGTVNPNAEKIYHRLGWQKLASSIIWVNITDLRSPEKFLIDYFDNDFTSIKIQEGNASARIPIIPLIAYPHDLQILDSNLGLFSSRYGIVRSCMGLYPKYNNLRNNNMGNWFVALDERQRVVGLSSASLDNKDGCQIDGFIYGNSRSHWIELINTAITWAHSIGVSRIYSTVSSSDAIRKLLLESMGFIQTGSGPTFNLDGQTIESLRMDL